MRFFGTDVRDKVVSLLRAGLETQFVAIDIKRGTTTPRPLSIDYDFDDKRTPAIMVQMADSETLYEEEVINDSSIDIRPEQYGFGVICVIKDQSQINIVNYVENYIEAVQTVLHGFNDDDITWIMSTGTDRNELTNDQNYSRRGGLVTFDARVS